MNTRKNIFLLGFMGSGKSTIGRKLSKIYEKPFVDLDLYIESEMMMTISEIFKKYGEEEFRKIEKECLERILNLDNQIISCGGGTPIFFNNMDKIKSNGVSIYLKHSILLLFERVSKNPKKRPFFNNLTLEEAKEKFRKTLEIREPIYMKSDIIIEQPDYKKVKKEIDSYFTLNEQYLS